MQIEALVLLAIKATLHTFQMLSKVSCCSCRSSDAATQSPEETELLYQEVKKKYKINIQHCIVFFNTRNMC